MNEPGQTGRTTHAVKPKPKTRTPKVAKADRPRLRILWHSNAPWAASGYGVQTMLFAPRIKALGHEVAISASFGLHGGSINVDGVRVLPGAFAEHGQDIVGHHAKRFRADVTISLMDAWVFQPEEMGRRWVPWFPVDADPLPRILREKLPEAWARIVFSRHAEDLCRESGIDVRYVPHGVDTRAFAPIDQAEARARLGLPADAFLVSAVMANKGYPSRKAWPEQLAAFAALRERHPDAMLYLHTTIGTQMLGPDLTHIMRELGIPKQSVRAADQYFALIGFPPDVLRAVYSASDVLLNCSMGEGFGVPILEAQACGCPPVVGGWTAMQELTGAGWAVPVERSEPYWIPQGAWQHYPHTSAIADALEEAYEARGDQARRERAREFAMDYDADRVTRDHWGPVLEEMAVLVAEEDRAAEEPQVLEVPEELRGIAGVAA